MPAGGRRAGGDPGGICQGPGQAADGLAINPGALGDLAVVERRARVANGRADAREQLTRAERLFDVVVRTEIECRDLVALVRACRNDNDRQIRPRANLFEDIHSVHIGKAKVENDEIGRDFAQPGLGLVATLDAFDEIAFRLQIIGQQQAERLLVLDDEDERRAGGGRSRSRVHGMRDDGRRFGQAGLGPAHVAPVHAGVGALALRGRSIGMASPVTR